MKSQNDFVKYGPEAMQNSLYLSIKFTLEVGGNLHEGKHEFDIFRRPTSIDFRITTDGSSYAHLPVSMLPTCGATLRLPQLNVDKL
jgi:hypothetical protein